MSEDSSRTAVAQLGGQFFEHSADVGIQSEGASLAECLARLAAGLFALMFVPSSADRDQELEVELKADSTEELAVAWLEELLYRSEVDDVCFVRFESRPTASLHARARVVATGARVEAAGPEVKAITRHG